MSILSKNTQYHEIYNLKSEITEPCILGAFFRVRCIITIKFEIKILWNPTKFFSAASAPENAQPICRQGFAHFLAFFFQPEKPRRVFRRAAGSVSPAAPFCIKTHAYFIVQKPRRVFSPRKAKK